MSYADYSYFTFYLKPSTVLYKDTMKGKKPWITHDHAYFGIDIILLSYLLLAGISFNLLNVILLKIILYV